MLCYNPWTALQFAVYSLLFPKTVRTVQNAADQALGAAINLGRAAVEQNLDLAGHVLRGDFAGAARSHDAYLAGLVGESQVIGFFVGTIERQIELRGAGANFLGAFYATYLEIDEAFDEDVDVRFAHVTNALLDCGLKKADCAARYAFAEKIAAATKQENEGPVERFTRIWLDWYCCLDEDACDRGAVLVDAILAELILSAAIPPVVAVRILRRVRKTVEKLPKRVRDPLLKKIDDLVTKYQDRLPETPRGNLTGSLDDLTEAERDFVERMLDAGKDIEVIPRATDRTPDFLIDGVRKELKTVSGVADHTSDGISRAIASRVMDGRGQSVHVVVDAVNQPGITQDIAERGIRRAFALIMPLAERSSPSK